MRNGTVNKCYESESCGDFSERICDLNIDEGYKQCFKTYQKLSNGTEKCERGCDNTGALCAGRANQCSTDNGKTVCCCQEEDLWGKSFNIFLSYLLLGATQRVWTVDQCSAFCWHAFLGGSCKLIKTTVSLFDVFISIKSQYPKAGFLIRTV